MSPVIPFIQTEPPGGLYPLAQPKALRTTMQTTPQQAAEQTALLTKQEEQLVEEERPVKA